MCDSAPPHLWSHTGLPHSGLLLAAVVPCHEVGISRPSTSPPRKPRQLLWTGTSALSLRAGGAALHRSFLPHEVSLSAILLWLLHQGLVAVNGLWVRLSKLHPFLSLEWVLPLLLHWRSVQRSLWQGFHSPHSHNFLLFHASLDFVVLLLINLFSDKKRKGKLIHRNISCRCRSSWVTRLREMRLLPCLLLFLTFIGFNSCWTHRCLRGYSNYLSIVSLSLSQGRWNVTATAQRSSPCRDLGSGMSTGSVVPNVPLLATPTCFAVSEISAIPHLRWH